MRLIAGLLSLFFIVGCNPVEQKSNKAYQARQDILATFSNTSVFREMQSGYFFLRTYHSGMQNEYVFTKNGDSYSLYRDSIQFSPDTVLNIGSPKTFENRVQLSRKVKPYFNKMDSLGITDISSDFAKHGIALKIYLRSKGILVYVPKNESVMNPEWRRYIASMKKLDDHWYSLASDK